VHRKNSCNSYRPRWSIYQTVQSAQYFTGSKKIILNFVTVKYFCSDLAIQHCTKNTDSLVIHRTSVMATLRVLGQRTGFHRSGVIHILQVAQLSQRDRAAECVSFGQKVKTGTGTQYFTDIIGLSTSTVTQSACKAIEFGEKTQNKGYYGVQGHSKSSRSVPIESAYATSYWWLIVTDILSRTVSELSQLIVQILDTFRFWAPFGGLGTTYDVHLGLIWKRVVDFLLVLIELFC